MRQVQIEGPAEISGDDLRNAYVRMQLRQRGMSLQQVASHPLLSRLLNLAAKDVKHRQQRLELNPPQRAAA